MRPSTFHHYHGSQLPLSDTQRLRKSRASTDESREILAPRTTTPRPLQSPNPCTSGKLARTVPSPAHLHSLDLDCCNSSGGGATHPSRSVEKLGYPSLSSVSPTGMTALFFVPNAPENPASPAKKDSPLHGLDQPTHRTAPCNPSSDMDACGIWFWNHPHTSFDAGIMVRSNST